MTYFLFVSLIAILLTKNEQKNIPSSMEVTSFDASRKHCSIKKLLKDINSKRYLRIKRYSDRILTKKKTPRSLAKLTMMQNTKRHKKAEAIIFLFAHVSLISLTGRSCRFPTREPPLRPARWCHCFRSFTFRGFIAPQ